MDDALELIGRWGVSAVWVTLPFTAGPSIAEALDPRSRAVQIVASVGLWALWAVSLSASLVPRTISLTAIRIIIPGSIIVTAWAATVGSATANDVVAIAVSIIATILVLSSLTGAEFVNGSSYGDERRFALKPPTALLLGPIEVAWATCVIGVSTGVLLLAAQLWIVGAIVIVVAVPGSVIAVRSLHQLSRRWIVFVPAGVVVHDSMALIDAVLLPRQMIARIAPALADTAAVDLTLGALGLAVEIDLAQTTPIGLPRTRFKRAAKGLGETIEVSALMVSPTRPGAVLSEAKRRRLPVA